MLLLLLSLLLFPSDTVSPEATVLFRVVAEADGRPIAGAHLRAEAAERKLSLVWLRGDSEEWDLVSDEEGWVEIEGLRPGRWRLLGRSEGRFGISEEFEVGEGSQEVADLALAVPGSLEVVVEAPGEVLSQLGLMFTPPTDDPFSEILDQCRADAHGVFRLEDLPVGDWQFEVISNIDGHGAAGLGGQRVDIVPGEVASAYQVLDGQLIPGLVTRDGDPVAATIGLDHLERPGDEHILTQSGPDGRFLVLILNEGRHRVRVVPDSEDFGFTELFRELEFGEELIIELPIGRIVGRVVDENGEALTASIQAVQIADDTDGLRPALHFLRSEKDGSFELEGLAAGPWRLSGNSETLRGTISFELDEEHEKEVELVLRQARRLVGRIIDERGLGLGGVHVNLFPSTLDDDSSATTTEADGSFVVEHDLEDPEAHLILSAGSPALSRRVSIDREVLVIMPDCGGRLRLAPSLVQRMLVAPDGSLMFLGIAGVSLDGEEVIYGPFGCGPWRLIEIGDLDSVANAAAFLGHQLPGQDLVITPGEPVEIE